MDDARSPPDDSNDPIGSVRRQIDEIDSKLLALVAERLQLADQVTELKTPQAGLPIRPGREVALLRRLVKDAQAPLERELVVELWRALIAASLRRQRVIDVVVGGGRDPTRLFDIARRHFGARTRIKDVGEPQTALAKVVENPETTVAVTWWPAAPNVGAWWPALSERRYHALNIIAGLPLLQTTEEPEAAVFAASPHEQAGNDVTMLFVFDRHHRLQRALKDAGLAGAEVSRAEPRALVRIDGFVAADDSRLAVMARTLADDVRVLGSYARI
ncbi:MAG TPA: chorismate mutase [Vitreimonas sp.]|uniref:chorismate mutase n=1 Tax=Vitreimonas sp. TaxID=3069702 RepID=UPI002D57A3D4|nr:chorismate mutase [Vitreimonas sp.]HYD89418.1 chorismate mutase [Vitreimonas sp.]